MGDVCKHQLLEIGATTDDPVDVNDVVVGLKVLGDAQLLELRQLLASWKDELHRLCWQVVPRRLYAQFCGVTRGCEDGEVLQ